MLALLYTFIFTLSTLPKGACVAIDNRAEPLLSMVSPCVPPAEGVYTCCVVVFVSQDENADIWRRHAPQSGDCSRELEKKAAESCKKPTRLYMRRYREKTLQFCWTEVVRRYFFRVCSFCKVFCAFLSLLLL